MVPSFFFEKDLQEKKKCVSLQPVSKETKFIENIERDNEVRS